MTKAPICLQDLRRSLYVKAEPLWRFWGLYVHVCKMETLLVQGRQPESTGASGAGKGCRPPGCVRRGVPESICLAYP
jgi:hypothetical protein